MITGLPSVEAQIDDPRLHEGQGVIVDLDAKIAARDHHGVGLIDDVGQIAHAALVFDLGDDPRPRAQAVEQRAQHRDILGAADERERKEVASRRNARRGCRARLSPSATAG